MYCFDSKEIENIKGEDFNVFEKPYTSKEEELWRWALYSVLEIRNRSNDITGTMRAKNTEDTTAGNKNYLNTHLDTIRSFYDNSWTGASIDYLSKMHGGENVLPARFVNYPIMRRKIDWMQGRYESAPIDMRLSAIDKDSVDKKIRKRSENMFMKIMRPFIESIEKQTGTVLEEDKEVPKGIEDMNGVSYKLYHETKMSKLIEYNFYKHSWMNEMTKGFKDTALYGFTCMMLEPENESTIRLKKVKLKDIIFDWECISDFGEDAMYLGHESEVILSELVSELRISKADADELKKHLINERGSGSTQAVKKTELMWKATRYRKVKKIPNPKLKGKFIYKIVKDGEEQEKTNKFDIIEIAINDWYKAIVIEDTAIVHFETIYTPKDHEDLSEKTTPFVVPLFNRADTYKPNGYGEMIIPVQELFNEVMYMLELEIATSPGRVAEYNISSKPKNVPLSDVFYHMKANKLIQTTERGSLGGVDLSPTSATIYLNILMFLENFIDKLTGIPSMAQGDVPRDTYVGTLNNAVQQAELTTKPLYTFYRESMRRLFKAASCYLRELKQGKEETLAIVMPEVGVDYFLIDGDTPYGDYDFFFNDGTETEMKRNMLIELGRVALNAGAATFSQIKDLIMEKDLNEVSKKLDKAFEEYQQKQEQAAQIENELRANKDMQPERLLELKGKIDMLIAQQKGQDNLKVAEKYAQEGMREEVLRNELDKMKKN